MPRRFLGTFFAVLALALLASSSAGAATLYEVTAEAKLTQDWSLHGTGECSPQGSGTITITLESRRPEIRQLRRLEGRPGMWQLFAAHGRHGAGLDRLVGRSAMSGSMVLSPPDDPEDPCPPGPEPLCVGKRIDGHMGTAPVEGPRFGGIIETNGPEFAVPPGRVTHCFDGYIRNFSGPDASGDPAEQGLGVTGRLGTPAEVAAKPKVFTFVGRDSSRFSNDLITYDTRRELRITFREVELRFEPLASSQFTVLHRGGFSGRFFPPWATARSYTWQMKRAHQSQWTTLGTTATRPFRWTFRLAGYFDYRVIVHGATAGRGAPQTIITRPRRFEVMFPTRDQILADPVVNASTQQAWTLTLGDTTPAFRREFGFWIFLDTCHVPRDDRRYDRTRPMIEGPFADAYNDAEINMGLRPPDDPNPPPAVIGCATYTVATFHTHTPTTYRLPPGGTRVVGPSRGDRDNAGPHPGFVFDYLPDPDNGLTIPYGHPMENPTRIYGYGPFRRPTPQR